MTEAEQKRLDKLHAAEANRPPPIPTAQCTACGKLTSDTQSISGIKCYSCFTGNKIPQTATEAGMTVARELIEQVAVAAGLHEHGWMADSYMHVVNNTWHVFAPDKSRQEAEQLAEQLGIKLEWEPGILVRAFVPEVWFPSDAQFRCTERFARYEKSSEDAAVCKAVVRAAACIGRAILGEKP